jgi:hypothetical protein
MRFQKVAARLEEIYRVPRDRQSAFQAKLKNLQKLGWPSGTNTGRGVAHDWSEKNFLDLAIVIELCSCGIPPERAIEITKANYSALLSAAETGGTCEVRPPPMFGDAMPQSTILVNLSRIRA